MAKRKRAQLKPGEIHLNFKKSKFDSANGIVQLFIELESGNIRHLVQCIESLTEIALTIIRDGDSGKPAQEKPDDLKDAAEKYSDWIRKRFIDIVKKFMKLLHHPKSSVAQQALSGITSIIQLKARVEKSFPWVTYTNLLSTLLSTKVDCRHLIRTLKKPLECHDLAFYTFKTLANMVRNRGANCSAQYKVNLVMLVLQLEVPPKKKPTRPPPLWCSVRPGQNQDASSDLESAPKELLHKGKKDVKDDRIVLKKQQKKKAKLQNQNKSRYAEVLRQGLGDEAEGGDGGDEGLDDTVVEDEEEEEFIKVKELDSEEEQRKEDDQEFKSAQKVKKARKPRFDPVDKEQYEEEFNDVPMPTSMPKPKFVATKNRLLPPGAFSIRSLSEVEEQPTPTEDEVEEQKREEEESREYENQGVLFKYSYKRTRIFLTAIWEKVMSFKLTEDLYKRCLVFIPEKVMDHLNDPVKLTDFFITSYNCGGGVSLMAMHGVFLLMHKHNLQYPDFYSKVYRMLEPSVFSARYKPRFFVLLDVFLRSSHLPEYVAAAFIKRLSLLLLLAPDNCTRLLVKFINNLMVRFPSLRRLYDDSNETAVRAEPFNVNKADMKQSGATESSLWEVSTVNASAPETLYRASLFVTKTTAPEEVEINDHLETEYEELDPSVNEYAENIKKVSQSTRAVSGFFSGYNVDLLYEGGSKLPVSS